MEGNRSPVARSSGVSRRGFWSSLAGELLNVGEAVKGVAQLSLNDIGSVPDDVAAEMIPVWRRGREPDIREDGVYRPGKDGQPVRVRALTVQERAMLAQYNCGRNLKVISQYVAQDFGLAPGEAFAATKNVFVQFCQTGLCHPAATHGIREGAPS